jgi:hypothetical protein
VIWACGLSLLLSRGSLAHASDGAESFTDPPAEHAAASAPSEAEYGLVQSQRIQRIVDDFRLRLALTETIVVTVVPKNELLVSVERLKDRDRTFAMSFETGFTELLNDTELTAAVAHELGHIWIFGHHPYLQTESLANDIALRLVTRESLDRLYEKVSTRVDVAGRLSHLFTQ